MMNRPGLIETAKQLERDEVGVGDAFAAERQVAARPANRAGHRMRCSTHRPFPTLFLSLFLRQIPHTQPQNILEFRMPVDAKFPWADECAEGGDGAVE